MAREAGLISWDEIDDDMGIMRCRQWSGFSTPLFTITSRGRWVDTDKFDIIPRKSYVDELLKEKDKEIEYFEKKIKELREDKEKLEKQKQG